MLKDKSFLGDFDLFEELDNKAADAMVGGTVNCDKLHCIGESNTVADSVSAAIANIAKGANANATALADACPTAQEQCPVTATVDIPRAVAPPSPVPPEPI